MGDTLSDDMRMAPYEANREMADSTDIMPADDLLDNDKVWETLIDTPTRVEGDSLKTFAVPVSPGHVQVLLKTNGRPLNSRIELWHGPDYTPMKIGLYIEDGSVTPFNAVISTPYHNCVACYNTGSSEYPLTASVVPDRNSELGAVKDRLYNSQKPVNVQGGSLKTFDFNRSVKSVQVLLKTDGRHLVAKMEILQGPNNKKQVVEVYSSDGYKRPFFAIFEAPEGGCVIRVINTQTVEYPFEACVQPYLVEGERELIRW